MIKELDRIALVHPLPEYKLEAGDIGTVVMIHQDGMGYTLEFMSLTGASLAIPTVAATAIRPLRDREIAHVRAVA
jgi:Domain of unknown function (DUF4926)